MTREAKTRPYGGFAKNENPYQTGTTAEVANKPVTAMNALSFCARLATPLNHRMVGCMYHSGGVISERAWVSAF